VFGRLRKCSGLNLNCKHSHSLTHPLHSQTQHYSVSMALCESVILILCTTNGVVVQRGIGAQTEKLNMQQSSLCHWMRQGYRAERVIMWLYLVVINFASASGLMLWQTGSCAIWRDLYTCISPARAHGLLVPALLNERGFQIGLLACLHHCTVSCMRLTHAFCNPHNPDQKPCIVVRILNWDSYCLFFFLLG
jgi:hypothetical protein